MLTALEVAQQQALAEGFAAGPVPKVNPANIYTQDLLGNPIVPVAEPVPYYPPATNTTPNLGLSLQGMDVVLADNMALLDSAAVNAGAVVFENAVTFVGFVQILGGLLDLSNSVGTPGQFLSTTGSGVLWSYPVIPEQTSTSAATAGTAGQLTWDNSFLYLCTVTGAAGAATWKKIALSSD
jgi:hypothetical protein